MDMTTSDRSRRRKPGALPAQEKHQPDPMLQMSAGDIGAGGITLVALPSAIVLGIVFYGLNSGGGTEQEASAPPAQSAHPASGGNSGAATPGAPRANESGVKG